MKKKICLLILFIIFIFSATGIMAAERTLTITSDEINIILLENASMQVTEKITIDFSGHWNGINRTLPINNEGSEIRNLKVSENGQDYTFNPSNEYGPPGTFLVRQETDGLFIDWSINVSDEVRTYELYYEITNVVKIHNDTAELYWKFIGDENEQRVDRVTVNMTLPKGAEKYVKGEDIKIWGHGPLHGEVMFDDEGIIWKASPLPARTYLEGRVVIPGTLFTSAPGSVYTKKDALNEILSQEQNFADEANRKRKFEKYMVFGGPVILLISLSAIFIIWLKHGRPHKTAFEGEYYRELPNQYSPAELNFLINKNKITSPAFLSTLLDLARKKYYKIEETTEVLERVIFDKEITTYRLTRNESADITALKPHEEKFFNLLFEDISLDGNTLTLEDIEYYTKKSKSFYSFWNSWTALIQSSTKKLDFFEKPNKIVKYTLFLGILLFILSILTFSRIPIFAMSIMVCGVLFMIIPNTFKRRTEKAEEDYEKWKAFKRFLLHFSQLEKHEIPSLVIWEHYLVYATVLGVAKEVLKQLKIVYPNLTQDNYRFGYGWFYFTSMHRADRMINSFDSFTNNIERSLKTAVSKASSGSGRGGGFSGGGGGGGGGGGFGGR